MNKSPKGFGKELPVFKRKTQQEQQNYQQLFEERMKECGNDYLKYIEKYNRHTLTISLVDEQIGESFWKPRSVTFFNEDNSINHMSFLSDFLELLTQEENRFWGTGRSDKKLVERITSFVEERVSPPNGFKEEEE